MKRKIVLALLTATMLACQTPVYASENDLLDEILAEQEAEAQQWLDDVAEVEEYGVLGERNNPLKVQVTCYIERGRKTCTGSTKMDGIIAAAPEYIGYVAQVYKVAEDGSVGDFIGYFPVEDTGYGAPTGMGKSQYKNRRSAGTIELGLTIDFRKPDMSTAVQFMKSTYTGEGSTGSQVYVTLEKGDG